MLGFSLPKLLLLGAIIALIWYGFKWVGRNRQAGGDQRVEDEKTPEIADMDKCATCGTFVPAEGARDCGREGCPYAS